MSQYMHFYIKTNNDIYYPIGTFSRSDTRYEMFEDYARWEKVLPLTKGDIIEAIDTMEEHIKNLNEAAIAREKAIEFLKTVSCDLDEKMERFYEYYEDKEHTLEEIERQKSAIAFGKTLLFIVEEAEDDVNYSSENYAYGIEPNHYIYVGLETGNPNIIYDENSYGEILENKGTGYKK